MQNLLIANREYFLPWLKINIDTNLKITTMDIRHTEIQSMIILNPKKHFALTQTRLQNCNSLIAVSKHMLTALNQTVNRDIKS